MESLFLTNVPMEAAYITDLFANGENRIESRPPVLEHDADLGAPDMAKGRLVHPAYVAALEHHRTRGSAETVWRYPQHGQCHKGFAAPGLTNQGGERGTGDVEAHIVEHGRELARGDSKPPLYPDISSMWSTPKLVTPRRAAKSSMAAGQIGVGETVADQVEGGPRRKMPTPGKKEIHQFPETI